MAAVLCEVCVYIKQWENLFRRGLRREPSVLWQDSGPSRTQTVNLRGFVVFFIDYMRKQPDGAERCTDCWLTCLSLLWRAASFIWTSCKSRLIEYPGTGHLINYRTLPACVDVYVPAATNIEGQTLSSLLIKDKWTLRCLHIWWFDFRHILYHK